LESIALSDLFTGPARVWQVRAAEARTEQALVQYQQAVQPAFREVEDALVGHRKVREIRPELEALVEANRRSLQIADRRALQRTTRDQLTSVVQLHKALGGGWTPETGTTAGR